VRELTPRQIVVELDKHIVGQQDAKRSVAIALRNRWRWKQLPEEIRKEVTPKNIIMIGPTGVGKTEIARRLANMTEAPFVKVEASKYTEVGYYGRDVESIIRELVDASITYVRAKKRTEIEEEAKQRVEERLLDLLIPMPSAPAIPIVPGWDESSDDEAEPDNTPPDLERRERTRDKFRQMLVAGALEDHKVELTIEQRQMPVQIFSNMGMEQMDVDFQNMFEKIMPRHNSEREVTVAEARKILFEQEIENLMDKDAIIEEAVKRAESSGMVFIDELDKVCGPEEGGRGPDVSRQGVQRDLLPIIEGTTIQTRHGPVKTDHMLFIAAGAFHRSKPSDLMPELQGRFPIRVELQDLTRDDFERILTEPTSSLTMQYRELLATDGITLEFTESGIETLADIAYEVNQSTQNIGARRLHTILERLLEDISFEAPETAQKRFSIDGSYVRSQLEEIQKDEDLSKFIL
jgi:ATP-dependent HslUV protease ATP-binding subunit HslU